MAGFAPRKICDFAGTHGNYIDLRRMDRRKSAPQKRRDDEAGGTVPVVFYLVVQEIDRCIADFAPHKICDFAGTPGIT